MNFQRTPKPFWVLLLLTSFMIFTGGVIQAEPNEESTSETKEHPKDTSEHRNHEEGHEEEEDNRKVGEGKAIVELHDEKGFRLSPQAYQALDITVQRIKGRRFAIPKAALVRINDTTNVYRYQGEFFKLVPAKVHREEKNRYIVDTSLRSGDAIVTQGMELLRVADVYSQDTSEYGH